MSTIIRSLRTIAAAALLSALLVTPLATAAGDGDQLDNASCQSCHDGQLAAPGADQEPRQLHPVSSEDYANSVHAKLQCVACHTEIVDSRAGHLKAAGVRPPDCAGCHQALWETTRKDHKTAENPRLGVVVANIAAYTKSFHARANKDDPNRVNASCTDCHNTHSFAVPALGTPERQAWRAKVPEACGASCHSDELDEFSESVHGRQLSEKHNLASAVCSDCHFSHDVANTSLSPTKLAITAQCGTCHPAPYYTDNLMHNLKTSASTRRAW